MAEIGAYLALAGGWIIIIGGFISATRYYGFSFGGSVIIVSFVLAMAGLTLVVLSMIKDSKEARRGRD